VQVSPLAARIPNPLVGRVRKDRRAVRRGHRAICEGAQHPPDPFREGREQGGESASVAARGVSRRRRWSGGADRGGSGEGIRLAFLESEGAGESRSSPHGVGPADDPREPLLLLYLGPGMGSDLLEDQRLRSLSHLALVERTRMGQAADGESGRCLRGARQRISLLRGSGLPAEALRSARHGCRTGLLLALVRAPTIAIHGQRSQGGVRVRPRVPPVRGLRYRDLRPAAGGSGVVRRRHSRSSGHRSPH